MKAVIALYRRADLAQRGLWFRVVASILALAACGLVFGRLLVISHSLDQQRQEMVIALLDQARNREAASSLREFGTIQIGRQVYGHAGWTRLAERYIDPQSGHILAIVPLIEDLLSAQKPRWAPDFLLERPATTLLLGGVMTAWMLLVVWLGLTVPLILTAGATLAVVALPWMLGSERWMLALAGMGLLGFTYLILTRAAAALCALPFRGAGLQAVAGTVLKEATRQRLSLVFIGLLLVVLPLLPLRLDPTTPLRYRVQTFISNSLSLTFAIAAVMTLVLSCATVAFEIRDRQIWQLLTKPLSRLGYLLGKWTGVMALNIVILAVSGLSIFMYVQHLRGGPVAAGLVGQQDRQALEEEVLTARASRKPDYEPLTLEQLRERVAQAIAADSELAMRETRGELSITDRNRLARDLQSEHLQRQRSIAPGEFRTYQFRGLQAARRSDANLMLRFRFLIGVSDEHQTFDAAFMFNEDPRLQVRLTYVPTITKNLPFSPDLIRDDGTLTISVLNLPRPGPNPESLRFEEKDFEVLAQAGTFEGNFLRAMMMMLVKLAFLAALGIACATFLSFPVACLLSFTMFIAGSLGPYLVTSLEEYYPTPAARVDFGDVGMVIGWVFQNVVRSLAHIVAVVFGSYGQYSPTNDLVEGRLISWRSVALVSGQVGALWSGLSLLVGYLVFRRRELATYSGHG
jgi:ABC-type transport system involved in multi-copper enzyme maturation permease subunit